MRKLHFMPGYLWRPLLCLWLGAVAAGFATAQDRAGEAGVKAGFIYNFAVYVDWPAADEGRKLHICALASRPLDGQLSLLQDRVVRGATIDVRSNVPEAELRQCQVVFFAYDTTEAALAAALKRLEGAPVLTIGDVPNFAQRGGMLELYRTETRLRFDINLASAQRAGLKVSSQLSKLAGRVWQ